MIAKKARTEVDIHELIASRWSPRAFDSNKPVPDEHIVSLMEAARWAPSCFNDQPWRFLVFNRFNNESAWEIALSCLTEKNQSWAKNAPVLVAAIACDRFTHNDKPNRWSQYDTGAASLSICLQAQALGMAAHQMGGFDAGKVKASFEIPEQHAVMAMMAIGYQGPVDTLAENFRESETEPRERVAIEERFFENSWGSGIKSNGK